jgi:hypothetical protein
MAAAEKVIRCPTANPSIGGFEVDMNTIAKQMERVVPNALAWARIIDLGQRDEARKRQRSVLRAIGRCNNIPL